MTYPIRMISPDTRTLADRLLATPVGEVITYDDLSQVLGSDIHKRRYLVQAGMKLAGAENGAIFANVHRIGYRRLPADDAPLLGVHARRRIRSTTRRASYAISRAVDTANDMSDAARIRAFQEISALELLRHVALDAARKALAEEDRPQPVAVAMTAMLAHLNGKAA